MVSYNYLIRPSTERCGGNLDEKLHEIAMLLLNQLVGAN